MHSRVLDDEVRGWALLAVAALAIAGVLAVLLALSRTPGIQDFLPTDFFRTALVTHVVFAFVVWYVSLLGLMSAWAVSGLAEDSVTVRMAALGPLGLRGATASFALLVVPLLLDLGEPTLNNYVPVVTHPAFYAGLALLFLSVALPVVRLLASMPRAPAAEVYGTGAAGLSYLVGLICFGMAILEVPPGLAPEPRNEILFWGGGHVLQFTNTALMLVVWQVVAERLHLVPPLPKVWFRLVLAAIATTALAGPVFYLIWDAESVALRHAFSWLYRVGLVVQPAIVMAALGWALLSRGAYLRTPGGAGLTLSLLLFAFGGLLGYAVGEGDTRTPAHYHAVIGGTTLAFFVFYFEVVLPRLHRPLLGRRWGLGLLWLYGVGQFLHSAGLFTAGTRGVARKTAGAAQGLDGAFEITAMVVMGGGAVTAAMGGVLFIVIALRRLLAEEGGD